MDDDAGREKVEEGEGRPATARGVETQGMNRKWRRWKVTTMCSPEALLSSSPAVLLKRFAEIMPRYYDTEYDTLAFLWCE